MKKAIRSRHFWLAFGLFFLFCISASLIPVHVVLLLTNSLLLAASTAVGIAYIPVAWTAMRDDERPAIQHIALGIAFAWVFSSLWRMISIFWLMAGQPMYLVNNDVVALCQAGIAFGAFYHLTSPGAISRNHPRHRWVVFGCVAGGAMGLAVVLIQFTPNDLARRAAEAVRPYIPR